MAKGTSKSAGRTLECPEAVGEYRRYGAGAVARRATGTGDPDQAAPLGRDDPHLRIHGPRKGLVERPLPGNGHGGCGRRLGETHRWKHRQGAPGRPHRSTAPDHAVTRLLPTPRRLGLLVTPATILGCARRRILAWTAWTSSSPG